MNDLFNAYGGYYDLLYRDKDYPAEVDYVISQLRRHAPAVKSILELGCGTGAHAEMFAQRGFTIHGIDSSETMLRKAHERKRALPSVIASRLSFSSGDLRTIRLGKQYDAIVALFHVMSYQTSNSDISGAIRTAAAHMAPGGVLFFDFWYGPAVLTEMPAMRVKRLEDEDIRVVRIADPILQPNENRVDVRYEVLIEDKKSQQLNRIVETHPMRYFFELELDILLSQYGFGILATHEWLTLNQPSLGSWNVCMLTSYRGS